jgi:hypothetical protein
MIIGSIFMFANWNIWENSKPITKNRSNLDFETWVPGTKFPITKFLITKFLITKFLITKFLSNKVPK